MVIFRNFDYGDWIIRENAAPEGYSKDDFRDPEVIWVDKATFSYDEQDILAFLREMIAERTGWGTDR